MIRASFESFKTMEIFRTTLNKFLNLRIKAIRIYLFLIEFLKAWFEHPLNPLRRWKFFEQLWTNLRVKAVRIYLFLIEQIPKSLIRGPRLLLSISAFSLTDRLDRSEEKFSVSGITEKEFLRYRGRASLRACTSNTSPPPFLSLPCFYIN